MSQAELTNMVMIEDKKTGKVLVQERIKSWKGISFPGGHVENNESFVDSAVREIKEETGLDIRNLKNCGVIHWSNSKTSERYLVFLYRTSDFSGNLLNETEEGRVFWASPSDLKKMRLAPNFDKYLPMFFKDTHSEAFGWYNNETVSEIMYK